MLWRGAMGPVVGRLQARLKELGFDPGKVDGSFGKSTARAVVEFQRSRHVAADGIVGLQTLSLLDMSPDANNSLRTLALGAKGPNVGQLQERLKELGFASGPTDHIFGRSTAEAVLAFQQNRSILADGIAGPQTLELLGITHQTPPSSTVSRQGVFVSYSHTDRKWLRRLRVHLAPLERSGICAVWDDTRIAPGRKWEDEIRKAVAAARVAVLLVSADFMASEFIASNELPHLLRAAERDESIILPVIVAPCEMGEIAAYQSVNPPTEPLVDLSGGARDRIWVRVVKAITAALNA